jgi:UDP-N-acetylglucosamine--N-acetylmuramyl-(pentapeptide) pyrophosphoryl-undecaprenol N-acetylglucosamine transferase
MGGSLVTIVLTGGGSGGHITPVLAVAHELKQLDPTVRLVYIGQKGDNLSDIPRSNPDIDEAYDISAGKFRRYHGEGLRQLLDVRTMALNARDAFRVLKGLSQSRRLLKKLQPDVVFIKGGFVGVPVGLAAAQLKIPYVTHDSDVIPGLANRIVARWAALHTVALPKEVYHYPPAKTRTVGVPVHANYQPVDDAARSEYAALIGLVSYKDIMLVTGGGLGAQRLNTAIQHIIPKLLQQYPELAVVHVVGRKHESAANEFYGSLDESVRSRVVVKGFIEDMHNYSGAASVIVTRAGATALAEFAMQHKACIVVPNPQLTGGHQTKNADYLASQGAIDVVLEGAMEYDLPPAIARLLEDSKLREEMGKKLSSFAVTDASRQLAMVLLEQAQARK